MSEHTPLPWELAGHDHNGQRIVRGEHIEICTCWHHSVEAIEREMEANAAYIVKACNAYPQLVKALEELTEAADSDLKLNQGSDEDAGGWWSLRTENAIRAARAALKSESRP